MSNAFQIECKYCTEPTQILIKEVSPHVYKAFNLDKSPHFHITWSEKKQ